MDATPDQSDAVTFDFRTLSARDRYKLMIGTVVPRPIALVTSVDLEGRINAAPFSFFNCLSADPPILALGVENHPDMSFKDTALNIRLTEVFTVNIVSHAIAEAMHICAVPFNPGRDELQAAGLTAMPGKLVASPWIKEAPAAFECRHQCLRVPHLSRIPSRGGHHVAVRPAFHLARQPKLATRCRSESGVCA